MKKQVKAAGKATAPTDLLVCFPARQHLALMPKSMCSPSRATLDRAVAARRRQLQLPPAQRSGPSSSSGVGAGPGGRGRGSSPLFRGSSKAKQSVEGDDEPQSPKVTCAGQIKVVRPRKQRPVAAEKNGRCGGSRWITVAEEMERLQEQRKKASWLEAFGVPLPFLGGALRSLRHKARCFGTSLRAAVESSTDDDEEEEGAGGHGRESAAAASVFSKWLMVLEGSQEPQSQDSRVHDDDDEEEGERTSKEADDDDDCRKPTSVPPANALLLMRCRSAPAKGLARKGAEDPPAGEEKGGAEDGRDDDLVFMRTAPDFLKLSIDIAKETWVVGGMDPLARSRSWKR